jgi:drug/metabolite transporter (DMT)-like permease
VVDHQLVLAGLGGGTRLGMSHHAEFHLRIPLRLHRYLQRYLDRVDIPPIAVVECVAGALCYAISSVLQQRAAVEQPDRLSMRLGLVVRLLRSGRWMLGNLLDVGGFAFQFLALRRAALALVEPLFVIGLVFSVVGAALAARRRPTRTEWLSSLAVAAGLALFVLASRPGPGHPRASGVAWVALFAATGAVAAGSVLLSRRYLQWRAVALGAASGIVFGVTSAVTEHTGHLLNLGLVAVLSSWAPYVLAAIGILGLILNQSAYQAGDLRLSLPVLTIAQPIIAIVIGQALFGEHIAATPLAVAGEVIGLLTMALGVIQLARISPAGPVGAPAHSPG